MLEKETAENTNFKFFNPKNNLKRWYKSQIKRHSNTATQQQPTTTKKRDPKTFSIFPWK
jgi:hypothetical protein